MLTWFHRATGITTDVVEQMERSLKRDVQREAVAGHGRVLLHDEVEDPPGQFTITPQWETVSADEIMTPRDVFELVFREGYKVDYARVAIVGYSVVTSPLHALTNSIDG